MFKLVHVKKIEYTNCSDLSEMYILPNDKCRLSPSAVFKEIANFDLVSCTIDDTVDNNSKTYTVNVSFKSSDKELSLGRKLAFRLTQLNGQQFLVGTKYRPYPIIKESNPFPDKPTNSYLKNFTITWKSTLPPLLII